MGFGMLFRGLPAAFEVGVLDRRIEAFDIEIVDIDEGMGNAPRHLAVMAEIRESRCAGHCEADTIEIVAGEMSLRIHARPFQHAMRIPRQQCPTGPPPLPPHRPPAAPPAYFGFLLF